MKSKTNLVPQVCWLALAIGCFPVFAISQVRAATPTNNKSSERPNKEVPKKPSPKASSGGSLSKDTTNAHESTEATYTDYVIGIGDVLSIVIWQEPELSTKVTVRSDGKIAMALVDEVRASGLTPMQLKETLTNGLKKFLTEPRVYVIPLEIRSQFVYIVGSVAKPGIYPLGTSMRVTELLVRAGGLAEFAKPERIKIVRRDEKANPRFEFNYKKFLEGRDFQQDILLRSGDMVVVP
jgi:polysaccharide export outer membrane protein